MGDLINSSHHMCRKRNGGWDGGIERLKWIENPANKTEIRLVTAIMKKVCILIRACEIAF